jgi:hypothetical protein
MSPLVRNAMICVRITKSISSGLIVRACSEYMSGVKGRVVRASTAVIGWTIRSTG